MTFTDNDFQATRVPQLIAFGNFLGRIEHLTLRDEVKDENDNILIQAKRPLRLNMLNSLMEKRPNEHFEFVIEKSDNLKSIIANKIVNQINNKMSLKDFSFSGYLLNHHNVDVGRVVRGALNNDFFYIYLTSVMFNEKRILNHLFEVALGCVGIMAALDIKDLGYKQFIRIFQAGILHDYSIDSNHDYEGCESFDEPDSHDERSADELMKKEIPAEIAQIIRTHNRFHTKYSHIEEGAKDGWYTDFDDLSAAILNLMEYHTYVKHVVRRNVEQSESKENEDETAQIIYRLGLDTEKGHFARPLVRIFRRYYNDYNKVFQYGQTIGKIEAACLFEKYALAYPKPRATQVLCKSRMIDCKLRQSTNQINVLQSGASAGGKFGSPLDAGWYDKCQLSKKLPEPPSQL